MRVPLIVLAFVAELATAQFSDGVGSSLGQRGNLPIPLRTIRYQKLPKNPALQSVLSNHRARRPPPLSPSPLPIAFRPKGIGGDDGLGIAGVPVFPFPGGRPVRPNIPPSGALFSHQVKPVTEKPEESLEDVSAEKEEERERAREQEDHRHRQEDRHQQNHSGEESDDEEERNNGNVEENLPPLRHVPGPQQPAGQSHAQPQAQQQYHRSFGGALPLQSVQRTVNPGPLASSKSVKPRKQIIEEPVKQLIKPATKAFKASSYDSRGKKPVAQIIRRYREDNPDGSITWGFENDDGSYKEEIIGVDCITRGKYGYVDPDGVRREYTYETGIKCDEEERDLDEENGFVDYQENKLVLPSGKTIDLSSMGKKQSRRPRPYGN